MADKEEPQAADDEIMRSLEDVKLSAETVTFKEPFTEDKMIKVRLANKTDRKIGFKIKTTRPPHLTARPAYGIVDPSTALYIKVKLHHLPEGVTPPKADRLTILVAVVPEGRLYDKPSDFWKGKDGPPKPYRRTIIRIVYKVTAGVAGETVAEKEKREKSSDESALPSTPQAKTKANEKNKETLTENERVKKNQGTKTSQACDDP